MAQHLIGACWYVSNAPASTHSWQELMTAKKWSLCTHKWQLNLSTHDLICFSLDATSQTNHIPLSCLFLMDVDVFRVNGSSLFQFFVVLCKGLCAAWPQQCCLLVDISTQFEFLEEVWNIKEADNYKFFTHYADHLHLLQIIKKMFDKKFVFSIHVKWKRRTHMNTTSSFSVFKTLALV